MTRDELVVPEKLASDSSTHTNYEVSFDDLSDPEDALRLSRAHKWLIVVLVSLSSVCITSISLVWSLASASIMAEFGVNHEASTAGIALYIWGMGVGGMFLSPISEFHGRKVVYVVGFFIVFCFQFVPAFSHSFAFILFSRFVLGFFALSFMSVASGTFSDLFKKTDRTAHFKRDQTEEMNRALVMYSASPFLGPGLGPLIAGFVCQHTSWRWVFYTVIIWSGVLLLLVTVFIPETYEPVLLKRKAARLRKATGDDRYYAPLERDPQSLVRSIMLSSERPFMLIFKDLMTLVLCFYTGFALAVVYMFFVSFPYIYSTVYGFNLQDQGLAFLGLILGLLITAIISPGLVNRCHRKLIEKNGGVHVAEYRFIPLFVGAFIAPLGLFIIAWTSYAKLNYMGPIIGAYVYGTGTIMVFNGIFSYTVEAYRRYTASAMAANSFVRLVMAGAFPMFAMKMYEGLGIHWATTLIALFACLLIPIPFVFYKYGARLRANSPYTWSDD